MACHGFVVPATTLVRAPSHDSAVIRSDRLGGNFAYSVQEGHAYAAISPVVQHVATPVAVSYETPAVVHTGYAYHGHPLAAAPVAVEAPTVEHVAAPAYVAAPYGYGYEHVGHIPVAGPAVTVAAPEVKAVAAPAFVAAPYAYGYQHAFPLSGPTVTVGAPEYHL